ncbi:MAG: hypothetical protein JNG89_07675 [Planctomycetaceae bacterium]|nr:hypothetical protein [Planctomycetaceae bacterium]
MSLPAASRPLLILGGAAVALALPPLLLRAAPANWSRVETSVAGMSQADRDRLDRNTREYLALTEGERQKYRDLHSFLESDVEESGGRVEQAMQDYCEWLASNQSYDRQQLRVTTDPRERVAEMQKIVDRRNEDFSRSRGRLSRWWLNNGVPDLSAEDLATLMSAVENRLPLLTEQERARLVDDEGNDKVGVNRYFAVFGILRGRQENLFKMMERADPDDLLKALPQLEMPPSYAESPIEVKRFMTMAMIIGNVLQEFETARNVRPPTTSDLEEIVANWPADKHDELERMLEREPADFRSDLERIYTREEIALDIDDVWAMIPREPFNFGGRWLNRGRRQDGDYGPGRRPQDHRPGEGQDREGDHPHPPHPEDGRGPDGRPFPPPLDGQRPSFRPGQGPPPQREPRNDPPPQTP